MYFSELSSPQITSLSKSIPIVFPIAAIEQHGDHLPVSTDTLLTTEIMKRVERELSTKIVVADTLWLGNSDHHFEFGSTLSASPRSYLDLLRSLVISAVRADFRRVVFINGHGGNDTPCRQALFECRQEMRERNDLLLAMATYWSLGARPWLQDDQIVQREMGHACEWETSMVLAIRPDLVGDIKSLEICPPGQGLDPGYRGWITKERTSKGHIGNPAAATKAKGEVLLDCFARDVVHWINRSCEWDGHSWDC